METAAVLPKLTKLADMLRRRPPALTDIAALTNHTGDYVWFTQVVGHLFPAEADSILAGTTLTDKIENFTTLFAERHFPIYQGFYDAYYMDWEDSPFSLMRIGIPYELMGLGFDGLHSLWDVLKPGIALQAVIAGTPPNWSPDPDGLRVAWLDSAADHVPVEILRRIPEGGIPIDTLSRCLKGTRFEAVVYTAQWVWADTGNFFLDFSDEDGVEFYDPWEEDVIEQVSHQWRLARGMLDPIHDLADWLDRDLRSRFSEMVDFIVEKLSEDAPDEEQEVSDG